MAIPLYITISLSLVSGLIVLSLIIWLIRLIYTIEEIEVDEYFAINLANLKNGGAYGKVKSITTIGNRYKVTMEPRDFSLQTLKENKSIKLITFIVEKNKIITFPKGTLSQEKHIQIFLPRHASDFPEQISNTQFGKCLEFFTEISNATNTELEAMREGFIRQKAQLINMGMGEVSIKSINYLESILKDVVEMKKDVMKDKPTMPFSSHSQSGGL